MTHSAARLSYRTGQWSHPTSLAQSIASFLQQRLAGQRLQLAPQYNDRDSTLAFQYNANAVNLGTPTSWHDGTKHFNYFRERFCSACNTLGHGSTDYTYQITPTSTSRGMFFRAAGREVIVHGDTILKKRNRLSGLEAIVLSQVAWITQMQAM